MNKLTNYDSSICACLCGNVLLQNLSLSVGKHKLICQTKYFPKIANAKINA